jgi:hypothetical protein
MVAAIMRMIQEDQKQRKVSTDQSGSNNNSEDQEEETQEGRWNHFYRPKAAALQNP